MLGIIVVNILVSVKGSVVFSTGTDAPYITTSSISSACTLDTKNASSKGATNTAVILNVCLFQSSNNSFIFSP